MKKCSRCKLTKPKSEFRKASRYKDGLEYYCLDCSKKFDLKYRIKNRVKVRVRSARNNRKHNVAIVAKKNLSKPIITIILNL